MSLFVLQDIVLHSGELSTWKIECDALNDEDIATLAHLIAQRVMFARVEGVPRGGRRLADALQKYADPQLSDAPLLIVDDVCTTGRSMEEQRNGRDAIGYVIFARGPMPGWVSALFTLQGVR